MIDKSTFRWMFAVRHRWQDLRASFWFVPAVIVVAAVALAAMLIGVDATFEWHFVERWPLLFGAGAEGSRGLLTAVAGSMITVAGVVFSITIVALSLTSSQYTSRVLRNFMRDTVNQTVLGVFVGIFAYCLVVLRTIRGGDEGGFVPSLAVLAGLLLAFVGIAFLIYFIHHISVSIQAANIIAAVASETIAAVDHLFPEGVGDEPDDNVDSQPELASGKQKWISIPAHETGYVEEIDGDALLSFANEHHLIVRMERGIGEFVIEGMPLVSMTDLGRTDDIDENALTSAYVVGRQRSVYQDAGFGIRQIVDIALKALSPGVNDSTTAVMCVNYLSAILVRLASRRIARPHRFEDENLRLIARGASFNDLLCKSFDQIRQSAGGNVKVLTQLVHGLEAVARATTQHSRRRSIFKQAELIAETVERTVPLVESEGVSIALDRLSKMCELDGRPRNYNATKAADGPQHAAI